MTTVSLMVNGDTSSESEGKNSEANFNMVSGMKDLCVGKMDSISQKENRDDNFQLEVKNALSEVMNNEEKKLENEVHFLKDLIASHLDIIQQQSEQLTIKDRLISKLKNENETLSMRLVRMDRRVNLQRRDPEIILGGRYSDIRDGISSEECETRRRGRRLSSDSSATTISKKSIQHSLRKRNEKKKNKDSIDNLSKNKIFTQDLYYTSVGDQECRWGLEPAQAKPSSQLEVPSWRIKIFSSVYTMEGTENLCDDIFLRRHSRLCQDEKRRKRWDVQRIREMRHNEKLRQRERAREEEPDKSEMLESLWPRPKRQTQLIVQETVPVSALGITLPNVPVRDFAYSSIKSVAKVSCRTLKRPLRR